MKTYSIKINELLTSKSVVLFTFVLSLLFLISCVSTSKPLPQEQLPEEYVPESEVVFLKQKRGLRPVLYPSAVADPYVFTYQPVVDLDNLLILEVSSLDELIEPNPKQDAQLYAESKIVLENLGRDPLYLSLLGEAKSCFSKMPDPYEIIQGEEVEKFSNAVKYEYPAEKGAFIFIFEDGSIQIDFLDGRSWFQNREGYFMNSTDGSTFYSVDAKGGFTIREGEGEFSLRADGSYFFSRNGSKLEYVNSPVRQYSIESESFNGRRVIFLSDQNEVTALTFFNPFGLRLDYYPVDGDLLITHKREAVLFEKDYTKVHAVFNTSSGKTGDILSIYLPEGIRFTGFKTRQPWSVINPQWPEEYQKKRVGAFEFLYTKKDKAYLKKLKVAKLNSIPQIVESVSGLKAVSNRAIILPPDLESYRKLYVSEKGTMLKWYPSGFQTRDYIVMWPPSIARYETEVGQNYFWETEFYEILVHEYTHLAAGEVAGLLSGIPVWLNEGMAVFVEVSGNQEVRDYWASTFVVDFKREQLLSWRDVTLKTTGEFPVAQARTHYAQSWKMVDFLIKKYGKQKLVKYTSLFRLPAGESIPSVSMSWKSNFKKTFGVSWEDNLIDFEFHSNEYSSALLAVGETIYP